MKQNYIYQNIITLLLIINLNSTLYPITNTSYPHLSQDSDSTICSLCQQAAELKYDSKIQETIQEACQFLEQDLELIKLGDGFLGKADKRNEKVKTAIRTILSHDSASEEKISEETEKFKLLRQKQHEKFMSRLTSKPQHRHQIRKK